MQEMAVRKLRPNLLDWSQMKIKGTPSPRTASLYQARRAAEEAAYMAAVKHKLAADLERAAEEEDEEEEEEEEWSAGEETGASAASYGSSRKRKAGEKMVSSTNGLNDSMKNLALGDCPEKSFEAAKPATKKKKESGDEMDFR
jgi:hypothetical protein